MISSRKSDEEKEEERVNCNSRCAFHQRIIFAVKTSEVNEASGQGEVIFENKNKFRFKRQSSRSASLANQKDRR